MKVKRLLRGACISLFIWSAVVMGLITFGTATPPAAATAITEPFSAIDVHALPGLLRYKARDGALLSYREYRASGRNVAVLLHGSAGSSVDMHPLALALQRAGVTVLVPDLRGHGANRPHGDIAYVGQLDDDLADFITNEKPDIPNSSWTVLGFSSGAAFGLRFAAESSLGQTVDRYLLVSPYLRYNAPSVRQSETKSAVPQSWAAVSTGRIIGLTILNHLGVHLWDGLPVLAFPVPENSDSATRIYSWRMQRSFGADDDYLADISRVVRPVQVLVGGSDELLDAERLKAEFQSQRSDIPVTIIPGLGHSDMVTRPDAIRALVAAFN
jgi:alpha-beta hydrolase superfamily lysophospholipase